MKYIMLRTKGSSACAFGLLPIIQESDALRNLRTTAVQAAQTIGASAAGLRIQVAIEQATLHNYFGKGLLHLDFADAIETIDNDGSAVVDLPDEYFGDAPDAFITVPSDEFFRQRRMHGNIEEVEEIRYELFVEVDANGLRLRGRFIDMDESIETFHITWEEIARIYDLEKKVRKRGRK
jgi:hypothetical protein